MTKPKTIINSVTYTIESEIEVTLSRSELIEICKESGLAVPKNVGELKADSELDGAIYDYAIKHGESSETSAEITDYGEEDDE